MVVCYFGSYNREYARNRILLKGLRENGAEVIECHEESRGFLRVWRLFRKHRALRNNYDAMIVGFAGQGMTLFAKLITRKPVVLDAFYSLYNTAVEDRKIHSSLSFAALYYWLLDWLSARVADLVLLDTEAHIEYYVRKFHVPREKFVRVFIGADDDIFASRSAGEDGPARRSMGEGGDQRGKIIIRFYGAYIPLHGVEYIVQAAKLLEKEPCIQFELLGDGQTYAAARALAEELRLTNLSFIGRRIPYDELPAWIAGADICLGIFGATEKARRVIPNKVYECVAMKKPVITMDSPAIRELFDEREVYLVPAANPEAIAAGIMTLKTQPKRARALAENGFEKFRDCAAPTVIGKELREILQSLSIHSGESPPRLFEKQRGGGEKRGEGENRGVCKEK